MHEIQIFLNLVANNDYSWINICSAWFQILEYQLVSFDSPIQWDKSVTKHNDSRIAVHFQCFIIEKYITMLF